MALYKFHFLFSLFLTVTWVSSDSARVRFCVVVIHFVHVVVFDGFAPLGHRVVFGYVHVACLSRLHLPLVVFEEFQLFQEFLHRMCQNIREIEGI